MELIIGVVILAVSIVLGIILFILILLKILELAPFMYTNAKIRAIEAGLLGEKIEELINSKGILECINSLEHTDYGQYLTKIQEPITSSKVEATLNQYLGDVYSKVVRSIPTDTTKLFRELLKIWDVKNIKSCLRAVYTNLPEEERTRLILNIGTLDKHTLTTLFESKTIEEIVSKLENTEYGLVVKDTLSQSKEVQTLLPIEVALDKFVLKNIYTKVATSKGPNIDIIKKIIGTRIDIINLKTLFRGKTEKLDSETLTTYMIPIYYNLKRDTVKNLVKTETIGETLTYLDNTPYAEVLTEVISSYEEGASVSPIEKKLNSFYLRFVKDLSIKSPLGIAPAINLLFQKEADVQRIRAIARFKEEGLSKEKVEAYLL